MTRLVVLMSAAVLAGCGNVEPNTPDDDGGVEGFAVEIIPTQFFDERGDHVAFSTGEPVHTHAGAVVTLGGNDCPAVYKYTYLLGPVAPPYGKEATPNPIAWKFRALGGTASAAEFRVRSAAATEIDWTPAMASGDGTFGVEIHRNGRNGFPNLEVGPKQYFIDFRVRDDEQREAVQSACWEHHPLSAPVYVTALVKSDVYDALDWMNARENYPIGVLMNNSTAVSVMQSRLVNQTSEPAVVRLGISKPVVAYTRSYVTDWLADEGTTGPLDCGITCTTSSLTCVEQPPQDVRCRVADPPVVGTVNGTLTTGKWTIIVRDADTQKLVDECVVEPSGESVTCFLPGRLEDRPAKEFLVLTRVNQMTNLKPYAAATIDEISWRDRDGRVGVYTGVTNVNEQFVGCIEMLTSLPNENGEIRHQCRQFGTLSKWVGLDYLELDIDAPMMSILTSNGGDMSAPPYHPTGMLPGQGFLWNSRDENLPGPY